ncbi:hypothetical protein LCGC14_1841070 [marine sediment metagenome]|uniref:HNH nuclease domain-containing protein n=1 Tax=marine sediment metagenome TaxID=412755 RepID=A0A0F9JCP5_9ZZZZ
MKKLTYGFIKLQIEKENYQLVADEYKGNIQKLKYICPKGHKHSISWNKWLQGRRCPFCKGNSIGSNIKHNIDYIKKEFKKKGIVVLSDVYINAHTKLKCRCSYGHEFYKTWANFNHNREGCIVCGVLRRSGDKHYAFNNWSSVEPYCEIWGDKEYKADIKSRDNNECQNSDCWKTNRELRIHHIDYIKKNCQPANLITLCNSCNGRANTNRRWYTNFYRTVMNKKYGYVYGDINVYFRESD